MASWDAALNSGYVLRLHVDFQSQNIAGNYSTWACYLEILKGSGSGRYNLTANNSSWSVNINGYAPAGSFSYDFRSYSQLTLWSGTLNFGHDGNGNLSFNSSGTVNSNSGVSSANLGPATASGSQSAPRNPRPPSAPGIGTFNQDTPTAATLSWSAPSDNGGAAVSGYRIQYGTASDYSNASTIDPGNVTSYQLTSLTPGATTYARVRAFNQATDNGLDSSYSSSASVFMVASVGDLDGWSIYGTIPAGLTPLVGTGIRRGSIYSVSANPTGLLREIQQSTAQSVDATAQGIQRTMTTKVGSTYTLSASGSLVQNATQTSYRFNVPGVATGTAATLGLGTTTAIPTLTFVATSTAQVITVTGSGTVTSGSSGYFEALGMFGFALTEIPNPSPQRLQDVGSQVGLDQHFNWASDTVGAVWWVDSSNVTQFRQVPGQSALKAIFTDNRAAGKFEYTDIAASYDTKNTVNSITVTNHGADTSGNATSSNYTGSNAAAISTYGVRSGSMDMEMRAGYVDRTNLLSQPDVGPNYTNTWATYNCTRDIADNTWGYVGSTCWNLYGGTNNDSFLYNGLGNTGIGNGMAVGKTYTFSATGRTKVAFSGNDWDSASPSDLRDRRLVIIAYNSSGGYVLARSASAIPNTVGSPTRLSVTFTIPAGTIGVDLRLYLGAGSNNGGQCQWDGLKLVETQNDGLDATYFDGAGQIPTDTSGDYVFGWTGTAGNSTSVRYSYAILNSRIRTILTSSSTPAVKISSVTWNAQSSPALAASLDIQDRIRVEFRGRVQDSRIIGIEHDMQGDRWMQTLTLVPA